MSSVTEPQGLRVDPGRAVRYGGTGIYVRAYDGEHWGSWDIIYLDRESVLRWLRAHGDCSQWVEDVVLHLLHHPREG